MEGKPPRLSAWLALCLPDHPLAAVSHIIQQPSRIWPEPFPSSNFQDYTNVLKYCRLVEPCVLDDLMTVQLQYLH